MNSKVPINTSICNSASYEWPVDDIISNNHYGISYSRSQHENLLELHARLALLYKREACAIFPSGMNAIYVTLHTIMKKTKKMILYMNELYCDTPKVIKELCGHFGWTSQSFATDDELLKLVEKYGEKIGIVFAESASNPHGVMIRAETYTVIKKTCPNIKIVIDNSWLSICYSSSLVCDVVIESMSKYLGGGEIIMGFVAGDENFIVKIYRASTMMGIHLSPTDCSKAMQSLKTIELRMDQCLSTMTRVLKYLNSKPQLNELSHSSSYGVDSAIVTFTMKTSRDILLENMRNFQWIKIATSYGKGETLIDPYLLKSKKTVIRLAIGYDPYMSSFERIKKDLDAIFC